MHVGVMKRVNGALSKDGYRAWTMVIAAFMALFLSMGVAYSFGVYHVMLLKDFNQSGATTAWVCSLNLAMASLGGRFLLTCLNIQVNLKSTQRCRKCL